MPISAIQRLTDLIQAERAVLEFAYCHHTDGAGEPQLLVYLASEEPLARLRRRWSAVLELPAWSKPPILVSVTCLPRHPDGSIDSEALTQIPHLTEREASELGLQLDAVLGPHTSHALVRDPAGPGHLHLGELLPHWSREVSDGSALTEAAARQQLQAASDRPAQIEGPELQIQPSDPVLLPDALVRAAKGSKGITYLTMDGYESRQSYAELLERASCVLTGLHQLGLRAGDKVIFQIEDNALYLQTFWACVLGGIAPLGIAVASDYRQKNAAVTKFFNIWVMLGRPHVLAEARLLGPLAHLQTLFDTEHIVQVSAVERLANHAPTLSWHPSQPEDTALYLLTSGSTGTPKAVVQTHGNLIRRSLGFLQAMDFGPDELSFNWLPIDHVTGIVMCHLRDVVAQWDQVHAPTKMVLQQPLKWLEALHHYRASISWAPNFAFRLINDQEQILKASPGRWDLSRVRFLENAGEPIVARTCRRFLELLAPFGLRPDPIAPAWGMAETCSTVTVSRRFMLELTSDADPFTDLGDPFPGFAMRIVNEKDEVVPEKVVGEFQCKNLSVLPGYYDNPAANEASYTSDGWFRTGDLAFIEEGRLTLTGRAKDVIIINGMNYYGHEIESAMDLVAGVSVSFTAAVAIRLPGSDTDSLAIFFHTEIEEREALLDLLSRIRAKSLEFGVAPTYMIPVAKEDIPKTGIGKIQRSHLQKRFGEGGFEPHLRRLDLLLENEHTLPNWFLQRTFVPRAALPARPLSGSVLIFLDRLGLGQALAKALQERGLQVVRVDSGPRFALGAPGEFFIDPLVAGDYATLFQHLEKEGLSTQHVIHLGGYQERGSKPTPASIDFALAKGPRALTLLLRILARRCPFQLDVVVNDAAPIGRFCAEKGSVGPFLESAQLDFLDARLRLIDLETLSIAQNTNHLLEELGQPLNDREVVLREGQRFVPRLGQLDITQKTRQQNTLVQGGLYVITGGLGALGVELALHLHRSVQAKLLLIGRSPLPADHPNPENPGPNERLARLKAAGVDCRYEVVDLCHFEALNSSIEAASHEWQQPLAGIFHLAGAMAREGAWSEAVLDDRFDSGFHAKTLGTYHLAQILEGRPEAIFVAFSSVYAVFGGATLSSYSAANGFLSTFTAWLRKSGVRAYCFEWSAWDGLGLASNLSESMRRSMLNQGFHLIESHQGMFSLDFGLSLEPCSLILGVDSSKPNKRVRLALAPQPSQSLEAWVAASPSDPRWPNLQHLAVADAFGRPLTYSLHAAPLTARRAEGSLDRQALDSLLERRTEHNTSNAAPADEIETKLAEIWRQILGLEQRPGVQRNFFDLGGDSVLSNQVQLAIEKQFQKRIEVLDFFRYPTVRGLASLLRGDAEPEPAPSGRRKYDPSGAGTRVPIAVIGLACRVPGAGDLEQFWANLVGGVDSITRLSRDEIAAAGVDPECYNHPNYVRMSPYLADAEAFDAEFFGYSPVEATVMDPQQRIFLEAAWHCLEHAGCDPERYDGAIGVYAGSLLSTHLIFNVLPNSGYVQPEERIRNLIGNATDNLATRVSYKLNLRGPSFSVQTNCSTGLVAIHVACSQLRDGQCDLALAGGVAARTPQKTGYLFLEGSLSSPDGLCRPFDHRAAGTLFGDGVGVVALKRLDEAIAEGDPILAVVRGSAINNDGAQKVGFSAPSIVGQQEVIEAALAFGDVTPDSISYIETHGTATKVGDPIEVRALTQAFRRGTQRKQFCALGSVKSNIGHLETAAGAIGFIKAVLALSQRTLPPTLHFEKANPLIDFANSPFYVQKELSAWSGAWPLRAGVSSFGIGGTNAHLILEEAPLIERSGQPDFPDFFKLFPLSARDPIALEAQATHLADWLESKPELDLADLAYTLQTGRRAFAFRRAIVCANRTDLIQLLREGVGAHTQVDPNRQRSVVFLFPGGGSQYLHMGRDLYQREPIFRAAFDQCSEILGPEFDLKGLIFPVPEAEDAARIKLNEIRFMLPVILSLEVSLARLLIAWGVQPQAMIGHSLGEYAAAILAEVFSLEDGLKIVAKRAELMQSVPSGAMLVVSLAESELRPELDENLSLAVINATRTCVVSGSPSAIAELEARLSSRGRETRRVHIATAAHSHLLDPILASFESFLHGFKLAAPKLPYISNISGTWISAEQATDRAAWCAHLRQTVQFSKGLGTLLEDPDRFFLEVGPGHTLSGLVGRHEARFESHAVATTVRHASASETDREFLLQSIASLWCGGLAIDWQAFQGERKPRRIHLPGYPFQRKRFAYEALPSQQQFRPRAAASTIHPFLDTSFRSSVNPNAGYWEAELGVKRQPYLRDHRVLDETLFPAAGYVECALAVARERYGDVPLVFTDLTFQKTLFLAEESGKHIQVSLEGRDEDGLRFLFASLRHLSENEVDWENHCQGTVRSASRLVLEQPDPINPEQVSQMFGHAYPSAHFYQDAASRGIHYGVAFQGLSDIQVRDGHAFCGLEPHPQLALDDYLLHPAVLDLCFQAALATLPRPLNHNPDQEARPFFPTGLGQLRRLGDFAQARWVSVSPAALSEEGDDPDTLLKHITVYDRDGQVLLEIRDFRLHRITEHHEIRVDDLFFETVWRPHTLRSETSQEVPLGGSVLIFADAWGLGSQLAKNLAEFGVSCRCVARLSELGQAPADPTNQRYLEPGRAAIADLLAEMTDLRTVFYLWGLDIDPEAAPHTTQEDGCLSLLHLTQALNQDERGPNPRLWLATRQVFANRPDQVVNANAAMLWGMASSLQQEVPSLFTTCLDLDLEAEAAAEALLDELRFNRDENQLRLGPGQRRVARLERASLEATDQERQPVGESNFLVEAPSSGVLEDLALRLCPKPPAPGEHELTLELSHWGINFRDVMLAMGLVENFEEDRPSWVGEIVGTVVAVGSGLSDFEVGDRVIAFQPGTVARWVNVAAYRVARQPASMSPEECATILITYLTAWYGLVHLGRLQRGERVLIHSAAGGVGIAAVRIAQYLGAEVFASAGSAEKQAFLHSLGVSHLLNSRTLDFADRIAELTEGEGVDVVLSALTGEAIAKNFASLATFGRYLEMGASNIIGHQDPALMPHDRDISYIVFSLKRLADLKPATFQRLLVEFEPLLRDPHFGPLPHLTFPISEVGQAFHHLNRSKHIGKVVVSLDEPTALAKPARLEHRFRADGTYLLSGGLGGLGLAFAEWMVDHGAGALALIGRSAPSAHAEAVFADLRARGCAVSVFAGDIGERADVTQILTRIRAELPPLRGVFHAAAVLADATLDRLDREAFRIAQHAKVQGAWLLDELTAADPLDVFVCFSSVVATLGNAGQANYASANAYLDALAHRRRARNVPALTVNWGSWARIGLAAASDVRGTRLASHGLGNMEPEQGLKAMEALLQSDKTQINVMDFQAERWVEAHPGARAAGLLRSLTHQNQNQRPQNFRTDLLEAIPHSRLELLQSKLAIHVAKALGLAKINPDQPLNTLGLDSLMSIELRNRIEAALGIRVKLVSFIKGLSLTRLAKDLLADLLHEASVVESESGQTSLQGTSHTETLLPPIMRHTAPLQSCPITHSQEMCLRFLETGDGLPYVNAPLRFEILGPLDVARLQATINHIVSRHDILRTWLAPDRRSQFLADSLDLPMVRVDLRQERDVEQQLQKRFEADAGASFDLGQLPQVRLTLYQLSETRHDLCFVAPHTLMDGWSIDLFQRELGTIYTALEGGTPLPPGPAVGYADFAVWERNWMQGPVLTEHKDWWRNHLENVPAYLELPTDYPRRPGRRQRLAHYTSRLPDSLYQHLTQLAQHAETTPYTLLMTGFALMLHDWTGKEDIVIGTSNANRNAPETLNLLGCFFSPQPMRLRLDQAKTTRELWQQVIETSEQVRAYAGCPYDQVLAVGHPQAPRGYEPLTNVYLAMQSFDFFAPFVMGQGLEARLSLTKVSTSPYDLHLMVFPKSREGVQIVWDYHEELFKHETIAQLAEKLEQILAQLTEETLDQNY